MANMRIVAVAAIAVGVLAVAFGGFQVQSRKNLSQVPEHIEQAFRTWMIVHSKSYATPQEHQFRKLAFMRNFLMVQANNANPAFTFVSELNKFSDLSTEEFKARFNGLKPTEEELNRPRSTEAQEPLAQTNQAAYKDWTQVTPSVVNPIENQGQCGSCWAFSTTGAVESTYAIAKNQLFILSPQQLVDCATFFYGNHGCNGGNMYPSFGYLEKYGQMLLSDYPYTAKNGQCKYDVDKVVVHITGRNYVLPENCASLKKQILIAPVAIGVDASTWSSYKGGIYNNANCGTQIDHGVVLVGYELDSGSNTHYWKVRNSWGTTWGESGYIRLNADMGGNGGLCAICQSASYPSA